MRTPKIFTDNIKKGVITEDMLESALFSVNKRAKNWRDRKRDQIYLVNHCFYGNDKFHSIAKAEREEKRMYKRKEELLTLLEPVELHRIPYNNGGCGYFHLYRTQHYSFHQPVNADYAKKQTNFAIKTLHNFETTGEEIQDLLSVQFVDKLLHLIATKEFIYIPAENAVAA